MEKYWLPKLDAYTYEGDKIAYRQEFSGMVAQLRWGRVVSRQEADAHYREAGASSVTKITHIAKIRHDGDEPIFAIWDGHNGPGWMPARAIIEWEPMSYGLCGECDERCSRDDYLCHDCRS
jgi:hypothetical protein